MNRPTPEDILAAKAACRARFGHERIIGIPLGEPIDLYVIAAAMGLREASAYVDARAASQIQARSALVVERCLWPDQKTIAAVRVKRGALDAKIEVGLREALGWVDAMATAQRFSAATVPPGFSAGVNPADLPAKAAELVAAHPSAELWSITNRGNGLALVMAAPEEDVYTAIVAAIGEASQSKRGLLTVVYNFVRDLIVWSPKPLEQYFDEMPGRIEDLANPVLEMGGASAAGSPTFL
jgi:hypothetical protein